MGSIAKFFKFNLFTETNKMVFVFFITIIVVLSAYLVEGTVFSLTQLRGLPLIVIEGLATIVGVIFALRSSYGKIEKLSLFCFNHNKSLFILVHTEINFYLFWYKSLSFAPSTNSKYHSIFAMVLK